MDRILRCPDCNTPLIPGSSSCIKCNKQFSKPIPKIAEPEPAEPPVVPISVTPIVTPPKSAYKPQSKVLSATVLVVVSLIALVTFVITQLQADKRQALAAEQAHQQALQARAAMIAKASEETPQQLLNDAREKQDSERINREQEEQSHVYAPAAVAANSQQGSTGSSGSSAQQQQAEDRCNFTANLAAQQTDDSSTFELARLTAGVLDFDADDIENQIPKLAPNRVDYWTQQVTRIRRRADADREEANSLPHDTPL